MSAPAFTPGPWVADDTNSAKLSKVVVSSVPGSNGSTVVIGNCSGPDREANARLIAAAPDLYAAAERALNYIENTEGELDITLASGDLLRATLAKARGEPA